MIILFRPNMRVASKGSIETALPCFKITQYIDVLKVDLYYVTNRDGTVLIDIDRYKGDIRFG